MAVSEPTLKELFPLAKPDEGKAGGDAAPGLPLGDSVSVELENAKLAPSAVVDAVKDSLGTFLDIRFSTVIAGAWAKARMLKQYRDKSRKAPEETFLVSLAKHAIQSKYKPSIELLVNEKPLDSLPFEIGVQLAMEGLVLKIQNGRITELRPGKCEASGKIGCRGYPIAERKSRAIVLPGVISLGQGIEIGTPPAEEPALPPGAGGR